VRIYRRSPGGVYQVEFSLPSGGPPIRQSTHERDKRVALAKAAAIVEAATRQWSRQEDLFASRDSYSWELAVDDWHRARMKEAIAVATIEIDGQNLRYLTAAKDGAGRSFFASRLLRDIDGQAIDDYVTQALALGLVPETVAKRLQTLRKVLEAARRKRGSDGRPLLAEMPPIPSMGRSRDDDGWGRSLTFDEWECVRLAFPTCEADAHTPGLRRRIFELAKAGPVTSAAVVEATGVDVGYVRSALWAASHPDSSGRFLIRMRERLPTARGQPLRQYGLWRAELPGPPLADVDQRGWVEIALWTGQHTADVNSFTPDLFNLGPGVGPPPRRLPAGSYVWRNSKNRKRTKNKIRDQVRPMPPQLVQALERLARVRGLHPDVPVAGHWAEGYIHKAFQSAAKRAGLAPVKDERGRPHLLSPNDIRRTSATLLAEILVENGVGLDKGATEIIADHLGHRGLDVARRVYDRAAGPRLGVVASMFAALHEGRRGPKSEPSADATDIAPTAIRKRK
jgi:hypothetical protein